MSAAGSGCRACGGTGSTWALLRDRLHGIEGSFASYRCGDCGSYFLEPQPPADVLAAHYPQEYTVWRGDPGSGDGPSSRRERIRARLSSDGVGPRVAAFLLSRLAGIETFELARSFPRPGRLLDVGSGRGEVLDSFARLGWATTGIEPGAGAAAASRRRGHRIEEGDYETLDLEPGFDLVVFSHSIEHLRDPRHALEKARALLTPGGRIFVATPNASGMLSRLAGANWWQLDAPRHLVVLSRAGLRAVAERAGLSIARLSTHSVSMGPLVSRRLARDPRYVIADWTLDDEPTATVIAARALSLGLDIAGVGDNLHAVLVPAER